MNKSLSRRLDRLTDRVLPSGPSQMIQIVYVSPNGVEENGPLVEVGGCVVRLPALREPVSGHSQPSDCDLPDRAQ